MVKAYEEDMEARRLAKLRREERKSREDKRRRARSSRGAALVDEGRASSSSGRPRRSASSSALSRSTTQSEDSEVRLPEDVSALKSFPLVDEWLMKVRLREVDGRTPKLRFEVRQNPAHWVPGSRMCLGSKIFLLEQLQEFAFCHMPYSAIRLCGYTMSSPRSFLLRFPALSIAMAMIAQ